MSSLSCDNILLYTVDLVVVIRVLVYIYYGPLQNRHKTSLKPKSALQCLSEALKSKDHRQEILRAGI